MSTTSSLRKRLEEYHNYFSNKHQSFWLVILSPWFQSEISSPLVGSKWSSVTSSRAHIPTMLNSSIIKKLLLSSPLSLLGTVCLKLSIPTWHCSIFASRNLCFLNLGISTTWSIKIVQDLLIGRYAQVQNRSTVVRLPRKNVSWAV